MSKVISGEKKITHRRSNEGEKTDYHKRGKTDMKGEKQVERKYFFFSSRFHKEQVGYYCLEKEGTVSSRTIERKKERKEREMKRVSLRMASIWQVEPGLQWHGPVGIVLVCVCSCFQQRQLGVPPGHKGGRTDSETLAHTALREKQPSLEPQTILRLRNPCCLLTPGTETQVKRRQKPASPVACVRDKADC